MFNLNDIFLLLFWQNIIERLSDLFHYQRSVIMNVCVFQNQIYMPPKDQSTCCGVCKNISCLYQHENGTTSLYKVGKASQPLVVHLNNRITQFCWQVCLLNVYLTSNSLSNSVFRNCRETWYKAPKKRTTQSNSYLNACFYLIYLLNLILNLSVYKD